MKTSSKLEPDLPDAHRSDGDGGYRDGGYKEEETRDIIRAAIAIAAKRRVIFMRLRQALQNNEPAEAIKLAKELCGVDEQACNRTDSSIN
jgi:hypothetical protein